MRMGERTFGKLRLNFETLVGRVPGGKSGTHEAARDIFRVRFWRSVHSLFRCRSRLAMISKRLSPQWQPFRCYHGPGNHL